MTLKKLEISLIETIAAIDSVLAEFNLIKK